MALLDLPLINPTQAMLYHGQIYLRHPRREDYAAWAALRDISRKTLEPWEPLWTDDELSPAAFRRRLKYYAREIKAGTTKPYLIFQASDDTLVGGCVLSHIRRGVARSASLGYWVGAPYVGQGYVTSAVRAVAAHAFERLGLQRLEAATLLTNYASQKVLTKVGFQQEGVAREYLQIAGRRQDHILFALLQSDVEVPADGFR